MPPVIGRHLHSLRTRPWPPSLCSLLTLLASPFPPHSSTVIKHKHRWNVCTSDNEGSTRRFPRFPLDRMIGVLRAPARFPRLSSVLPQMAPSFHPSQNGHTVRSLVDTSDTPNHRRSFAWSCYSCFSNHEPHWHGRSVWFPSPRVVLGHLRQTQGESRAETDILRFLFSLRPSRTELSLALGCTSAGAPGNTGMSAVGFL